MKAFLMHEGQDFDLKRVAPPNAEDLIQDLELNTLLTAMAGEDHFLFDVGKVALLSSLTDPSAIVYRQEVLKDCLRVPSVVREMYEIAVESAAVERKIWYGSFRTPGSALYRANEIMHLFVGLLRRLRKLADAHAPSFQSRGFTRLFSMLEEELDDRYFSVIETHLRELAFRDGVLISARLGAGNKGDDYILRKPNPRTKGWLRRVLEPKPPVYSFAIADRDESGARALTEMRDLGINLVANALSQSADHIRDFFSMLRTELAFYIGCMNLRDRLVQLHEPFCFPHAVTPQERMHSFRGLFDICLSLRVQQKVVGNDLDADDQIFMVITGANQGGKSTLLRSVGLAQLMMQCGMFVAADSFASNTCDAVFTHYKREEDKSMKSGKLDEELNRMSIIADRITPNSLLLLNESFAATNEREGSEIARQIVLALLERRIKIFFVTHLYEFARRFHEEQTGPSRLPEGGTQRRWAANIPDPTEPAASNELWTECLLSHLRGRKLMNSGELPAERKMDGGQEGRLLRFFVNEGDRHQGVPVYQWIVMKAREMGIARRMRVSWIGGFRCPRQGAFLQDREIDTGDSYRCGTC